MRRLIRPGPDRPAGIWSRDGRNPPPRHDPARTAASGGTGAAPSWSRSHPAGGRVGARAPGAWRCDGPSAAQGTGGGTRTDSGRVEAPRAGRRPRLRRRWPPTEMPRDTGTAPARMPKPIASPSEAGARPGTALRRPGATPSRRVPRTGPAARPASRPPPAPPSTCPSGWTASPAAPAQGKLRSRSCVAPARRRQPRRGWRPGPVRSARRSPGPGGRAPKVMARARCAGVATLMVATGWGAVGRWGRRALEPARPRSTRASTPRPRPPCAGAERVGADEPGRGATEGAPREVAPAQAGAREAAGGERGLTPRTGGAAESPF